MRSTNDMIWIKIISYCTLSLNYFLLVTTQEMFEKETREIFEISSLHSRKSQLENLHFLLFIIKDFLLPYFVI